MRVPNSWDSTFLAVAQAVALRSKDPKTRVGCVVVDAETNRPMSTGYNGFPPKIKETPERWSKPEKKKYVVHAERNALDHCKEDTRGAVLYCTLFPCPDCCLTIISKGISRVVYLEWKDYPLSVELLSEAGIPVEKGSI
jgi:dCMP deaminase